jgi:hypothetical protein
MDNIDSLLGRMRDLPLDPRLDAIDSVVFEGLARQAGSHVSSSAMAMVAVLSLGIGLAGSLAPAEPAHAATVFPLGAPAALAPSTLLGGR